MSDWQASTVKGGEWESSNSGWGVPAPASASNPAPAKQEESNTQAPELEAGEHTSAPAEVAAENPPAASEQWTVYGQGGSAYDYDNFANRDGEFDGNAAVYHWDGEEGDVGPEHPELEIELFGPEDKREVLLPEDFTKYVLASLVSILTQ